VLIASGPDYASPLSLYRTPLADILPAAPTGRCSRAVQAACSPMQAGSIPSPAIFREVRDGDAVLGPLVPPHRYPGAHRRHGHVGPDDKPLIVLSRTRKAAWRLMLSDQGWLWTRGFEGGGPQTELLRRMAHWLMKEPDLEEEALTGRQEQGHSWSSAAPCPSESEPVTVTAPSGEETHGGASGGPPGLFQARLEVTEAGIHRLDDGTMTSVAAVGSPDSLETLDLHATADKLQPVVQESRGGIAWLGRHRRCRGRQTCRNWSKSSAGPRHGRSGLARVPEHRRLYGARHRGTAAVRPAAQPRASAGAAGRHCGIAKAIEAPRAAAPAP
jgi:hypothetical protein